MGIIEFNSRSQIIITEIDNEERNEVSRERKKSN
jgi:hypothetical protein